MTYDTLLRLGDDPDVNAVIRFLRERHIVHIQRSSEAIQLLREKLNQNVEKSPVKPRVLLLITAPKRKSSFY